MPEKPAEEPDVSQEDLEILDEIWEERDEETKEIESES